MPFQSTYRSLSARHNPARIRRKSATLGFVGAVVLSVPTEAASDCFLNLPASAVISACQIVIYSIRRKSFERSMYWCVSVCRCTSCHQSTPKSGGYHQSPDPCNPRIDSLMYPHTFIYVFCIRIILYSRNPTRSEEALLLTSLLQSAQPWYRHLQVWDPKPQALC